MFQPFASSFSELSKFLPKLETEKINYQIRAVISLVRNIKVLLFIDIVNASVGKSKNFLSISGHFFFALLND